MSNTRWKPSATVAAVIARQVPSTAPRADGTPSPATTTEFLLVEELTRDGLRLNNPAGHLDPGESPIEGCAREALEETAFHFKPTALVGVYLSRFEKRVDGALEDITYLRFAFCGELGDFVPGQALDEGIVHAIWMSEADIRACPERHRSPLLLKCMDDYLAGKRFPLSLITTDPSVYEVGKLALV